ncbi:MAG TPA: glycosyl hydrolase family 28 protein [Lacunisphaera sp.]|jgi:polygalacturonase
MNAIKCNRTFWLGILAMSQMIILCGAAGKKYPITDFGAVAGNGKLNTSQIQSAINAAAKDGGGVVEIPAGEFRSGSLFLKPGVELYLAEGALLRGSENIEDYPKRLTRIEGHFEPWRMALVNAQEMKHVRISGPGKLNGSGPVYWAAFWQRRKQNPKCTNLEVERPRLVFVDRCRDVRIEGVQLEDSGFWNLHLYRCQGVVIQGVRITIPSARPGLRGPSTDGIDVDSSQNVTISHCYISTGDDDIALKGSKGPHADQDVDSPPVEKIAVEDCEIGDGNGLITCGSEANTIRDVTIRNCLMSGHATVLTLKLRPDTPQHYENIVIDGIKLAGGGRILNVAPWMQFFDLEGQPPPSRTVENITIRNVSGSYRAFGRLLGNPGDVLRNITLENFRVELKEPALQQGVVENLVMRQVVVNGEKVEVAMGFHR